MPTIPPSTQVPFDWNCKATPVSAGRSPKPHHRRCKRMEASNPSEGDCHTPRKNHSILPGVADFYRSFESQIAGSRTRMVEFVKNHYPSLFSRTFSEEGQSLGGNQDRKWQCTFGFLRKKTSCRKYVLWGQIFLENALALLVGAPWLRVSDTIWFSAVICPSRLLFSIHRS